MTEIVGKVVVPAAGTPVQLSAAAAVQAVLNNKGLALARVQAVLLQALYSNTGKVYLGNSAMVKATLVGCGYVLGIPVADQTPPAFGMALNTAAAGVDLSEIWLDVDVSGEGVLITLQIT